MLIIGPPRNTVKPDDKSPRTVENIYQTDGRSDNFGYFIDWDFNRPGRYRFQTKKGQRLSRRPNLILKVWLTCEEPYPSLSYMK